jgi:hypothetical protein
MKTITVIACLALTIIGAPQAEAWDRTANSFLPGCHAFVQGYTKQEGAVICEAYIWGVVDGMIFQQVFDRKPLAFCPPEQVTVDQIVRVVVKYIDQHPEETDQPFTTVIWSAVIEAWWRCKH